MRRYSTFLPSLLLTAMGLEGCATTSEPPMSGIALPTLSFDPEIALTALASGRLVARDGCLRLVGKTHSALRAAFSCGCQRASAPTTSTTAATRHRAAPDMIVDPAHEPDEAASLSKDKLACTI